MDQTVIVGMYQFVGFHLTKHLLELGEDVIGIDWEFNEEKELEIGRNANFSFLKPSSLSCMNVSNETMIYISWYDFNNRRSVFSFKETEEILLALNSWSKVPNENRPTVVLLYPLGVKNQKILSIVEQAEWMKVIYLPTIYGPGQHEESAFEVSIHKKSRLEIEKALEREYKNDAIFIADLLENLPQITTLNERMITVKSKQENQWSLCAKLVFHPELLEGLRGNAEIDPKHQTYMFEIENHTSPEEGIALQVQHRIR
ncbi:NAD-dependent epimerase/dehydratase family protein [Peribacillus loiseleuriae]|uniref:NAD-dependent epimerase/dehydratase family protein n=1 Tax=Peribacillus loiseleuriae TaxID=1679170 RepID=UPI003D00D523